MGTPALHFGSGVPKRGRTFRMFIPAGRHLLVLLVALALETGALATTRTTTFGVQATVSAECGIALDGVVRAAGANFANAGTAVATTCSNAAPCKVETRRIEGPSPADAAQPERPQARDAATSAVIVTIMF